MREIGQGKIVPYIYIKRYEQNFDPKSQNREDIM